MNENKKQEALEYLSTHPLDYAGCAEIMNMTYLQFMEYRGMYLHEFMEVEERTYNLLEHLVMLATLGQPLPDEYKDFNFQRARWVLQCRRNWSVAAQKAPREPKRTAESSGEGKRLIDEYFSKGVIGDESGVKILSAGKRRDVQ